MADRFYVATRKGLFTVARNGGGWSIQEAEFLGDNVSLVCHDPRSGVLHAALDHGHFGPKMHRRQSDAPGRWEECEPPTFPEKPPTPEGEEDDPHDWSVRLIWALAPGGPEQSGRLWMGTIPGGLFRSDDDGASWQLVDSLWSAPERRRWTGGGADQPGIHSICVDPRDSDHLTLAISVGGVWQSRDGGATWSCDGTGMRAEYMPEEQQFDPVFQDPHCVVQAPSDPDVLWCQHHNGVFHSTDGGANWRELTNVPPSVFGFPVAVHPHDAKTAWFLPAIQDQKRIPVDGKVVVARTRDAGDTFRVLTRGLPQEHGYDLVLRHALDVDESGDRLAFGSTTGSVWVTEDGGESWQAVSHHLPPVYAVRFAG